MHPKKVSISGAIDTAIRSNKMEGLELSQEALAILKRVNKGEITLEEFERAAVVKYTAFGKGKNISYEQALIKIREEKGYT